MTMVIDLAKDEQKELELLVGVWHTGCELNRRRRKLPRTLMFQPRGPNFFLSSTIAWKKHRPNTIRLQLTPRTDTHQHGGVIVNLANTTIQLLKSFCHSKMLLLRSAVMQYSVHSVLKSDSSPYFLGLGLIGFGLETWRLGIRLGLDLSGLDYMTGYHHLHQRQRPTQQQQRRRQRSPPLYHKCHKKPQLHQTEMFSVYYRSCMVRSHSYNWTVNGRNHSVHNLSTCLLILIVTLMKIPASRWLHWRCKHSCLPALANK